MLFEGDRRCKSSFVLVVGDDGFWFWGVWVRLYFLFEICIANLFLIGKIWNLVFREGVYLGHFDQHFLGLPLLLVFFQVLDVRRCFLDFHCHLIILLLFVSFVSAFLLFFGGNCSFQIHIFPIHKFRLIISKSWLLGWNWKFIGQTFALGEVGCVSEKLLGLGFGLCFWLGLEVNLGFVQNGWVFWVGLLDGDENLGRGGLIFGRVVGKGSCLVWIWVGLIGLM